MIQAALNFTPDYEGYPADFGRWIRDNEHVYSAFKVRALRMAMTGRKCYSARTIVETIRWETDIADTDKTFRINDHFTPGMARLFMAEYGRQYPDFFKLRDSRGNDV